MFNTIYIKKINNEEWYSPHMADYGTLTQSPKPKELYEGDWEWLSQKWAFNNTDLSKELYNMSTFDHKHYDMGRKEYQIAENGLCLITVDVLTVKGDFCDEFGVATVVAMIDTGSNNTFISGRLLGTMKLRTEERKVLVRGHEYYQDKEQGATLTDKVEYMTHIGIGMLDVLGQEPVSLFPLVRNGMEESGFDVTLGSDFLKHIKFERDGKNGVFTITVDV